MRRAECWLSPHCDGEEELINRHQEGYRTSTNNAAARSFMSISTRMLMLLQSLVSQWRLELSALRCTLKKKLCLVGLWGSVVAIGPRSSTLSFSSSSWPSLYEVKDLLTLSVWVLSLAYGPILHLLWFILSSEYYISFSKYFLCNTEF